MITKSIPMNSIAYAGLIKILAYIVFLSIKSGVVVVSSTAPMEIRVRARVDASNATFYNRSLMGLKIG